MKITILVEHGLAELSGMVMAADCEPSKVYKAYIVQSFPWINLYVNYTLLLGIITQVGFLGNHDSCVEYIMDELVT